MSARSGLQTIVDAVGNPVAEYVATPRKGQRRVELVRLLSDDVVAAATAVNKALRGHSGSCISPELATEVVRQGAAEHRHFSFMRVHLGHPASSRRWTDGTLPDGIAARRLALGDASALAQLEQRAYSPGRVDHQPGELAALVVRNHNRISDPARPLMREATIAFDGPAPVGAVCVQRWTQLPDMEGPWLTNVCRDPARQYAGLGADLISLVLNRLRLDRQRMVFLAVSDKNPARDIYERLGFTEYLAATHIEFGAAK